MMMKMRTMVWSLLLFTASLPLVAAELEGEVRWGEPLTLSTNLEAEVLQAAVRAGAHVKKGTLLVQLDDSVLRAQLAATRAAVAHQKLLLSEAQSELQRSEELYERTLLSDHDLDLARIALAGAESGYQRANAALVAAQRDVTHARQVAPFDGVVLARHVRAGEMLNGRFNAVPLYTLVAMDNRVVRLVVGASQVAGVTLGRELMVQVGAQHYTGSVEAITSHGGKTVLPQVTLDIRLLPGKGETVGIGEAAKVKLP